MGVNQKKAIVVIDDQTTFAEAMGLALSLTDDLVCVATGDSTMLWTDVQARHSPSLIVAAYQTRHGKNGLEAAQALRSAGDRTPVLMLTPWPAMGVVTAARDLRNVGVVSKSLPMRAIVEQMRRLIDGRPVDVQSPESQRLQLSPREMNVLTLLGEGRRAVEIADDLALSIHTVRDHIKEVLSKLNADTQLKAVLNAQRLGLLVAPTGFAD